MTEVYTGHLFSNGTEHECWRDQCYECRFFSDAATVEDGACEVELAVTLFGLIDQPLPVRLGVIAGLLTINDTGDAERWWSMGADDVALPVIGRCQWRRTDDDDPDDDPRVPPPNPDQLDLLDPRNADTPVHSEAL